MVFKAQTSGVEATRGAVLEPVFRYDINALRALAVLAVVAYHYGVPGFGGGFAGVDVFLSSPAF